MTHEFEPGDLVCSISKIWSASSMTPSRGMPLGIYICCTQERHLVYWFASGSYLWYVSTALYEKV